jgi:hypothetical protein
MTIEHVAAGDLPIVVFVQSWNPSSGDAPRASTRVFDAAGYAKVQGASRQQQCSDVYMYNGSVSLRKLQKTNKGALQQVAQQLKEGSVQAKLA